MWTAGVVGGGGLDLVKGLPACCPEETVLQDFGVDPEANAGIAGGNEFGEDKFTLVFSVSDMEVTPAEGFLLGGPFGAEEVGEFLFGHGERGLRLRSAAGGRGWQGSGWLSRLVEAGRC